MSDTNRKILLAAHPKGMPKESDFEMAEEAVPEPGDGQVVVKTKWLTVDPYMRGRMSGVKTYVDPFELGQPIVGGVAGEVVASKFDGLAEGDSVFGMLGWQDYNVADGATLQKLDPSLAPIQTSLYALGMPGMTAYFGFLDICQPKEGETVYVSGAAGAVGSLVGQIAKIKGCRAVGSAGSDAKVDYLLNECGFDAAFNYKTTDDYVGKLRELCPNGIDCYFDNVGGPMTDAAFANLNTFARISICGVISQYNVADQSKEMGPRTTYTMLLVRQARAEGFIVTRFQDRFPEGIQQMGQWLAEGKIKYRETVTEGLENTPKAFIGLFQGENIGKQLVKVG